MTARRLAVSDAARQKAPRSGACSSRALVLYALVSGTSVGDCFLGGICGGAMTPMQAASVAAAYALVLTLVVYRTVSLGDLTDLLVDSARSTTVVALIIGGAFVFNDFIAAERIPEVIATWLGAEEVSPLVFLLLVNLLILVVGCLLDATTMLLVLVLVLVLVPLSLPTCRALGVDLVHLGVVVFVNSMIGLITPPDGVLVFVISGITGSPLREMIREIWPFPGIPLLALLTMVLVPETVLWLPRRFGYAG